MNKVHLPAGIEDNNLEIYRYEGQSRVVYRGSTLFYLDLPLEMREPFQSELIGDLPAQRCLIEEMGFTDADAMESKFVGCRYGNWDKIPDLIDGQTNPDAPNCEKERNCPGFGILCLLPEGPNGRLTPQQYFIIRLIAQGKLDKEIADELNIELPTVRTHFTNIRYKLGVNKRIEIALWAQKKGIV